MLACIVARRSSKLVRIPIAIKLPVMPLWLVTHAETRKMSGVKALVQYIREAAERDAAAFEGLDGT
jgi:hypothetical protein